MRSRVSMKPSAAREASSTSVAGFCSVACEGVATKSAAAPAAGTRRRQVRMKKMRGGNIRTPVRMADERPFLRFGDAAAGPFGDAAAGPVGGDHQKAIAFSYFLPLFERRSLST